MALPATDGFDGSGALSASWTITTTRAPLRSSGVCRTFWDNDLELAFWNADSFNNDQYSKCKMNQVTSSSYNGPSVRNATGPNCYAIQGTTSNSYILKNIGGTETTLQTTGTGFANGNIVKLQIEGSTLKAYIGTTQIGSDQASGGQLTSGAAGIYMWNPDATLASLDDWEGGNVGGGGATAINATLGESLGASDAVSGQKNYRASFGDDINA